jgi:hypothetical protein
LLDDLSREALYGSGSAIGRIDCRDDLARNRHAALEDLASAIRNLV